MAVSAQDDAATELGERVQFPGFSVRAPADYEGPHVKRQNPATYLSWTGPKRLDTSQPLFLITVTDIEAAPDWTGYREMTLGKLTDHFVQQIARNSVGFKSGDMEEVKANGVTFRRVPYTCQIKNNAMHLVNMRGWIMATREGKFLYTITASDEASQAAPTLQAMKAAAATFRWEEIKPQKKSNPMTTELPEFVPAELPPLPPS